MNNLKLVNLIILTVIGMLAGCKKDDASSTQANYYVKYTVVSNSAPYIGVKLKTNINNESNLIAERLIGTGNWEYIVGPVNKDFKASLSVVKDGWTGQVENHLKINLSNLKINYPKEKLFKFWKLKQEKEKVKLRSKRSKALPYLNNSRTALSTINFSPEEMEAP